MSTIVGIVVGCIYICSFIFLFSTYAVSMCAIWMDKELLMLSCYKLILAVGITDMVQVVLLGLVGGVASICNADGGTLPFKILGAVAASCWYGSTATALVLSFNRFLVCWSKKVANSVFEGRKAFMWIGTCYLILLAMLAFYCYPSVDLIYSSESHLWFYNTTSSLARSANRVNEINNIVTVSLMTGFHIGIFAILKMKRLAASTSARNLSKNERRAIAPAFIISLSMVIASVYWLVAPNFTHNAWTLVGAQLSWMYTAGMNGILFVMFNKTIKIQVQKLFRIPLPQPPKGLRRVSPGSGNATGTQPLKIPTSSENKYQVDQQNNAVGNLNL